MFKRDTGHFDESKVRRDGDGKFAPKGGGGTAPSIRQRQLVEASPGRLLEQKWRPRGAALFNQGKSVPPGNGHNARSSWERLGNKIAELPPEYTGSSQRESPVDGYRTFAVVLQKPKQISAKEDAAIRGGLVATINANRDGAIERATERGLIGDDVPKGLVRRAYNLAAIRAMHEYGVIALDYTMGDEQRKEMAPLEPAMRFFQRRIGDRMRADPATKGRWQAYKEEFGVPYADRRLDRRPGKGNQLRLKWAKSQGHHTQFIKATMPGELAKARPVFPRADPQGGRLWLAIDAAGEWGANKWAKFAGRHRYAERPQIVARAKAAAAAANADLPAGAPRRKPKQEAWEAAKAFDAETASRRHYDRQRGRAAVHLSMGAVAGAAVGAGGTALAQRRDDRGRFAKALMPGEMLKLAGAARGVEASLEIANQILADAAPGPSRRPQRTGALAREVAAILPVANRILAEAGAQQRAMAPERVRHRASRDVIADPRRSLAELLG